MSKISELIGKAKGFIDEFEANEGKKKARKARSAVRSYLKLCRLAAKDGVTDQESSEMDSLLEHVVICLKSAKPE